jgi:hypothetical protein
VLAQRLVTSAIGLARAGVDPEGGGGLPAGSRATHTAGYRAPEVVARPAIAPTLGWTILLPPDLWEQPLSEGVSDKTSWRVFG